MLRNGNATGIRSTKLGHGWILSAECAENAEVENQRADSNTKIAMER